MYLCPFSTPIDKEEHQQMDGGCFYYHDLVQCLRQTIKDLHSKSNPKPNPNLINKTCKGTILSYN